MTANFKSLIDTDKPVLFDFYANWCGPCKTLSPILKRVKEELGDQVKIIKIDIDKNQKAAQKFQIKGVPTMLLYYQGKQVWRNSGLVKKQDLISLIQSYPNKY